ncbi:MAG: hypothetical protein Kow0069_38630 [Promethearchaeota archaeon]
MVSDPERLDQILLRLARQLARTGRARGPSSRSSSPFPSPLGAGDSDDRAEATVRALAALARLPTNGGKKGQADASGLDLDDWANSPDFSFLDEAPAGLLARALVTASQKALPKETRKALSVYFTGPRVAKLAAELLVGTTGVDDGPVVAMDPAAGAGGFLLAALEAFSSRVATTGQAKRPALRLLCWEALPCLAELAEAVLNLRARSLSGSLGSSSVEVEVVAGDILAVDPPPRPIVDLLFMNPPYTSLERLPPRYRRWLAKRAVKIDSFGHASGRGAGLHHHLLVHASKFLKPGGRLALVAPETLLNMVHSTGPCQFLLNGFHVEAVLRFGGDAVISSGAGFGEVLLVARRLPAGEGYGDGGERTTAFLQFADPSSMSPPRGIGGFGFGGLNGPKKRHEPTPGDPLAPFPPVLPRVAFRNDVDSTRLRVSMGRWSRFFRELPVLLTLERLGCDSGLLVPGEKVLEKVVEGKRVRGADVFFLPNPRWEVVEATRLGLKVRPRGTSARPLELPASHLRPALQNPRLDDGFLVPPVNRHVVSLPARGGPAGPPALPDSLAKYFSWWASEASEQIPKSRKAPDGTLGDAWYWSKGDRWGEGPLARVAFTEKFLPTTRACAVQYLDPPRAPVGSYYLVSSLQYEADPGQAATDLKVVVAWHQSTPGLMFRYLHRQVLGPGSERLLAEHLERWVPCLDPRAVPADEKRALSSIVDSHARVRLPPVEQQVGGTFRRRLDQAVLAALGARGDEAKALLDQLEDALRAWCLEVRSRRLTPTPPP